LNRLLVAKGGDEAVIWLIPPLEESLKTGIALLLWAAVPPAHGVFGLLEAVHDYWASPRWGLWAGLSSIISHFFLGWGTVFCYSIIPSWIMAVGAIAIIHAFWNFLIIKFTILWHNRGKN